MKTRSQKRTNSEEEDRKPGNEGDDDADDAPSIRLRQSYANQEETEADADSSRIPSRHKWFDKVAGTYRKLDSVVAISWRQAIATIL